MLWITSDKFPTFAGPKLEHTHTHTLAASCLLACSTVASARLHVANWEPF